MIHRYRRPLTFLYYKNRSLTSTPLYSRTLQSSHPLTRLASAHPTSAGDAWRDRFSIVGTLNSQTWHYCTLNWCDLSCCDLNWRDLHWCTMKLCDLYCCTLILCYLSCSDWNWRDLCREPDVARIERAPTGQWQTGRATSAHRRTNGTWHGTSEHRRANGRPAAQQAHTDGRIGRGAHRARTDWPMADRPRIERTPTKKTRENEVVRNEERSESRGKTGVLIWIITCN